MIFFYKLLAPGEHEADVQRQSVEAENKTQARKLICKNYREDTPPSSAGFYSFANCKLIWDGESESTD